jgi:2-oxoglutarate dehydrogenase E2 component (dihydrolipoamide succinyltransferase)
VRRLAREHGLDVAGVVGSGRGGRVTRDDVLRHLAAPLAAPTPSTPPPVTRAEQTPFETRLPMQADLHEGTRLPVPQAALPSTPPTSAYRPPAYAPLPRDEVVPFSRRRAQIADHMVYSLGTSAHVAAVAEIDMLRVTQAKAKDAPAAARAGVKLTFMPYVVQAVAQALGEHPELNATVVDRALVLRGERNVGVAVDTEAGLVVPVVRRADELGLLGLARAIEELSAKARAGKLTADDVSNGTFTLSNPGRDGNLFGISIIRQPEVGILRIGSIVKRPVVREVDGEDVVVVRPIMYAALSYDHRVIDGRTGNGFLARVAALLAGARPQLSP